MVFNLKVWPKFSRQHQLTLSLMMCERTCFTPAANRRLTVSLVCSVVIMSCRERKPEKGPERGSGPSLETVLRAVCRERGRYLEKGISERKQRTQKSWGRRVAGAERGREG